MRTRMLQWVALAAAILILAACGQTPEPTTPTVDSVTINEGDQTVLVGETFPFTVTVEVTENADDTVTWSSDNESVATVNADTGVVTAVASGTAQITATSIADSDVADSVTVTVPGQAVNSVTINEDDATIDVGGSITYTATVDAQGGADDSVTWSSDNDSVATVDENGAVTGASDGTATITATSDFDDSKFDSVTVRVLEAPDLSNIYVDAAVADTDPQNGSATYPFDTIQEGVDAVNDGGTINVAPGNYNDTVSIGKSVEFLGAFQDTLTGRGGALTESRIGGQIAIAGDAIDVSFNGFQFRSNSNPSLTSSGVGHTVAFTFNLFNDNIRQLRLDDPDSVAFTDNIVVADRETVGGFLWVRGDWDGVTGTSVTITDNATLNFNFATDASPAIHVANVSGTISGNNIDMLGAAAGQDNTRIGLLITGTTGDLTVTNNTIANANQGIRFFSISPDGLGPVTIDGNTIDTVRQGIVVDAEATDGSVDNVTVSNNTISNTEEGARLVQAGLTFTNNTFDTASTAYVIDESATYDLNAIVTGNTFTPAAGVDTTTLAHPAILETRVDSVTINEGDQTITEGDSVQLSVTVVAQGGADESVTWSSDNETVATVDASGLVTGQSAGTANITATSNFDGTKSDTVMITVQVP